jgi:hypothetical protein
MGYPVFCGWVGEDKPNQVPFGDDNRKGENKIRSTPLRFARDDD